MTAKERQTLRAAIDQRRRELVADDRYEKEETAGQAPLAGMVNHGTPTGYERGCRCDPCRTASTAARRERRQRARLADDRRQRLLAAIGPCVAPVDREQHLAGVLQMLTKQANRISRAASADSFGGSMADAAEGA